MDSEDRETYITLSNGVGTASASAEPEMLLRRAVAQTECIKIARTVITLNPLATGIDIAEAVALELGKEWPKRATKKRNGNAIKRWLLWLEPHVVDPMTSIHVAASVRYAIDQKAGVGRPSLRKSLEEEVRSMAKGGMSPKDIAEQYGVTRQTIYSWMRKLGLRSDYWKTQRKASD